MHESNFRNCYLFLPENIRSKARAGFSICCLRVPVSVFVALTEAFQNTANRKVAKCFFLDAPGGTGKTFVINAFIHLCRSKRLKIMATAFSGIAANLLINGRTCHSQFKLPLNSDTSGHSSGRIKGTEKWQAAGRDGCNHY